MADEIINEGKYKQMTETPVQKLIPRLAVPTVISMLVTSIYNMADTFFVSQIGTSASGAVGVMFSSMAMVQGVPVHGICQFQPHRLWTGLPAGMRL